MNIPADVLPILQALARAHGNASYSQALLNRLQSAAPDLHAYVVRASQAELNRRTTATGLGFIWAIPIIASIAPIIVNRLLSDPATTATPTTPSIPGPATSMATPIIILGALALVGLLVLR